MKNNMNTGELVINYLASCGKSEVKTIELLKAVAPGCERENAIDEAFGRILPVLTNLESEGLVRLSNEPDPSSDLIPRLIHVLPKMKKPADKLMQDNGIGGKAGSSRKSRPETGGNPEAEPAKGSHSGRERKEDAVMSRFHTFVDLMEKKGKQVRIGGEWNRLIATIIYHDIDKETGFESCVDAFINGLIWQAHRKQKGDGEPVTEEEKAEPQIRPELLSQIDEIVRSNEQLNGELKGRKNRHKKSEDDAPLTRLERSEIRNFMRCLNSERDEIQPGKLWQQAVSRFFSESLGNLPVYDACREAFRAGVIFQMHRKKLEG